MFLGAPLTRRVHELDLVSFGLAILSRKGRGKACRTTVPRVRTVIAAPYLSPCGRG